MSDENFRVTVFLVGLAATLTMGAIRQADWKHKALIWSMLAVAAMLACVGVAWPWIKDEVPRVAVVASELAASSVAWFVIVMVCVTLGLLRRPASNVSAPGAASTLAPSTDALEARIAALEADLARVAGELRPALKDLAELHRAGATEIGQSVAALRETVQAAAEDAQGRSADLEGRIADVEKVAKTRIDQAYALFERHYDDLKAGQEAIVRALRARDAEAQLRSLVEEETRLFDKLMRASRADYEADETGIMFLVGWNEDFGAWERGLENFWRVAAEWGHPFPDILSISRLKYGMVDGKPPGTIQKFDMEQRWRMVAVVSARHREKRESVLGAVRAAAVLPPPSPT